MDRQPHLVEDLDFTFSNGFMMTLTVDPAAGDYCKFDPSSPVVLIHMTEKESLSDPAGKTPPEDITIMLANILCIQHRIRAVEDPTAEQKEEWRKAVSEMSGKKPARSLIN